MGEAKRRGTYAQRKYLAMKTNFKYQPVTHSKTVFNLLVFLGLITFLILGSILCKWVVHIK